MSNPQKPQVMLLQGNESCAEAILLSGASFFAGYPITPSTEIAEILAERLPKIGGKFVQMEDEIGAMAAIVGASLTGAKSVTATSGPGFSLKQENIGFASFTEVPCVIVNVQRSGPSTGLPTSPAQADVMQARWGTHGDHPIVVLSPATVNETFDLTIKAFNISESLRVPVILLMDEIVAHMREKVVIPPVEELTIINRKKAPKGLDKYMPYDDLNGDVPDMSDFGAGYRYHVTGLYHDQSGFPTSHPKVVDKLIRRLHTKLTTRQDEITFSKSQDLEDADIAIVSFGVSARSAFMAANLARKEGIAAGVLQLQTIWPFPQRLIEELSEKVKTIIVPELNLGQIVGEVERYARGKCDVIGYSRVDGEPITPEEILQKLREVK